jgi:hypothetical protein
LGRFRIADPFGHGIDPAHWDRHALGPCAGRAKRDARTRGGPGTIGAGKNAAHALEPGNLRESRLDSVAPQDEHQICGLNRAGRDLHQDVTGFESRLRRIAVSKHRGGLPGSFEYHCFHGFASFDLPFRRVKRQTAGASIGA